MNLFLEPSGRIAERTEDPLQHRLFLASRIITGHHQFIEIKNKRQAIERIKFGLISPAQSEISRDKILVVGPGVRNFRSQIGNRGAKRYAGILCYEGLGVENAQVNGYRTSGFSIGASILVHAGKIGMNVPQRSS